MAAFRNSFVVAAPIEAVWEMLMAFPNIQKANRMAGRTSVEPARGAGSGGPRAGDPRGGRALLRILENIPPRHFVVSLDQRGIKGRAAYHLRETDEGMTRLEHETELELPGLLRILGLFIMPGLKRDARALKAYVESQTGTNRPLAREDGAR